VQTTSQRLTHLKKEDRRLYQPPTDDRFDYGRRNIGLFLKHVENGSRKPLQGKARI
jgi:hypothetical protein